MSLFVGAPARMKPRRVIVTVEIETAMSVRRIRECMRLVFEKTDLPSEHVDLVRPASIRLEQTRRVKK